VDQSLGAVTCMSKTSTTIHTYLCSSRSLLHHKRSRLQRECGNDKSDGILTDGIHLWYWRWSIISYVHTYMLMCNQLKIQQHSDFNPRLAGQVNHDMLFFVIFQGIWCEHSHYRSHVAGCPEKLSYLMHEKEHPVSYTSQSVDHSNLHIHADGRSLSPAGPD